MVGLGIGLWAGRRPSGRGEFVSPNGLDYYLNNNGALYYEDSAASVPATDEADTLGAAKTPLGTTATQGTGANEPTLNLTVSQLGGYKGILCVDSQSSPTAAKHLQTNGGITTAHNSSFWFIAQHAREAAFSSVCHLFAEAGTVNRLNVKHTGPISGSAGVTDWFIRAEGLFVGSSGVRTMDGLVGVVGAFWDGTWVRTRWNEHEVGERWDGTGPGFALLNGDHARYGADSSNSAGSAAGWIGMFSPFTAGAPPSKANRDLEFLEHGRVLGLANGGKGRRTIVFKSNSLGAGWPPSGYTDPFPDQVRDKLDPTKYDVGNFSRAAWTTAQLASEAQNSGNIRDFGNWDADVWLRVSAVTDATQFDVVLDATGGSPSLGTDLFSGWIAILETGTQKGMGQHVVSNGAGSLTLDWYGFPAAPSVGDKLRLYRPDNQLASCVCFFYEGTNDLWSNGLTDGPGAHGDVLEDTPVAKRYFSAQIACKGYGFLIVGAPMTPRTTPYTGDPDDWATLNGWIEAWDGWDYWLDLEAAPNLFTIPSSAFADDVHYSNSGANEWSDEAVDLVTGTIFP